MKTLDFKPIDVKSEQLIKKYVAQTGYIGSDYSYFAYLIWFYRVEYAEGDRALFLRAFFDGKLRYWQPLVSDGMTYGGAVAQLPENCEFFNCSKQFADELAIKYNARYNRDDCEYIYLAEDFISLVGKRFNAKRNHIHKFKTLYNYDMRPYEQGDRDEVLAFEEQWLARHSFADEDERRSALREREIMFAALDASLSGKTKCDLLRVDGKLVGFSAGEALPSDCAVIIYEKADIAYDGIYSFLAHEFAARNFADRKYINRQEDMGIEGLRKSKLSYCPEFLLDKYALTPIRGEEFDAPDGDILGKYQTRRLRARNFNTVMGFLQEGIASLEDKKFFLNYTDSELMNVLDDGYMLGAFDGDRLIATAAVDLDKQYGNKLAEICSDASGRQYYEFSGIMVDADCRRQGVAGALCKRVIAWAKANLAGSALCAVVQRGNAASICNLQKLGFELSAEAPFGQYDFEYMTLKI